jgi:hypothetical protein
LIVSYLFSPRLGLWIKRLSDRLAACLRALYRANLQIRYG